MHVGMLWFDNNPKMELSQKIEGAAYYYENKYGKRPNCCYVHPAMPDLDRIDGIEVKRSRSILPNHFWLGIDTGG